MNDPEQINPEQSNGRSPGIPAKGTGLINLTISTIAAACGIQTRANHERDFSQGKASSFILAGAVFLIVFVLLIYGVVQLVLKLAS